MKEWKTPFAAIEYFAANEYVAACGDGGTTYYFQCNAGNSRTQYAVKLSDGTWLAGPEARRWAYYHPCNETHTATDNGDFIDGEIYTYRESGWGWNKTYTYTKVSDVIVWTDNGTNVHCTTNLNMDSWETAKS